MFKINEKYIVKIFFLLIVLSFFIGFFLDENSAGAGGLNGDFKLIWNNLLLFKENGILSSIKSELYSDSRTPFLYIINYLFNPSLYDKLYFRLSVFSFSFLVPLIFFFILKKKFKYLQDYQLLLLSSLLFLSPYFRTTAYWGLSENYSFFSILLSYFFFYKLFERNKSINLTKENLFVFLLCFFSSTIVYFDQKLFFIPLIIYLKIISSEKNLKFKLVSTTFYILFSLPLLYLINLWGSILPPAATKTRLIGNYLNLNNIGYSSTIIAFYIFPLLFFKKDSILLLLRKFINNKNNLFLITIIVSYLMILFFFNNENIINNSLLNSNSFKNIGGGFYYKFILLVTKNYLLKNILLYFGFLISFLIIFIFLENFFIDKSIIILLLISSVFIYPIFQEYFDPLILILIFTFFKTELYITNKNLILLTIYLGLFLLIANIYYLNIIH